MPNLKSGEMAYVCRSKQGLRALFVEHAKGPTLHSGPPGCLLIGGLSREDPASGPLAGVLSTPQVEPGERKKAKSVQKPQNHANDYDGIQDRLNGARHRYKAIDEPEENPNHNQDDHNVNQIDVS